MRCATIRHGQKPFIYRLKQFHQRPQHSDTGPWQQAAAAAVASIGFPIQRMDAVPLIKCTRSSRGKKG